MSIFNRKLSMTQIIRERAGAVKGLWVRDMGGKLPPDNTAVNCFLIFIAPCCSRAWKPFREGAHQKQQWGFVAAG